MRVFKNLFGDGSKIHAGEIILGDQLTNFLLSDMRHMMSISLISDWNFEPGSNGIWLLYSGAGSANNPEQHSGATYLGLQLTRGSLVLQLAARMNTSTDNLWVRRAQLPTWFGWKNLI